MNSLNNRYWMVFTGSGGQGVITAAIILAEAAVIYDNLTAVQSQAYGAAARGGTSRSDVVISKTDALFPELLQPNVMACMTQESYDKFYHILRPGGLLLSDPRYVVLNKKVAAKQIELPIYKTVMDNIGKPIVYNMCMLGTVIGMLKVVRLESILKVLEKRVPLKFFDINKQALELGVGLVDG